MHCVRRTALRSAIAASRQLAPKAASTPFAVHSISRAGFAKCISASPARFFSQTARAQSTEESEKPAPEPVVGDTATTQAPTSEAKTASPQPSPYSVFVRNVVFDATEEHVATAFSKYGEVVEVQIARNPTGLSRGYAFVYFKDQESVQEAIENCDGTFWHGRRINVTHRTAPQPKRRERASIGPTRSLYLGNIPYDTTDAELNRIFRDLPNVTDIRVAVDRTTGWPRGFAHADFSDVESAQKAMAKLQEMQIGDRKLVVDFAAESQGRKKQPETK